MFVGLGPSLGPGPGLIMSGSNVNAVKVISNVNVGLNIDNKTKGTTTVP